MNRRTQGAVFNAELADANGGEKKWSQLFPWGRYHRADYPDGHIDYDGPFFATLLRNWEKSGKQPIPIDYFHRGHSIDGDGNGIEDKIASGWIHNLEVRDGEGVWAQIEWTPRAKQFIQAGELRYLSPTFLVDSTDPLSGKRTGPKLMSAGLLNDPYFSEMPRVAASVSPPPPVTKEQSNMDKKLLCAAFGVGEDTPDDKLLEMAKAYAAGLAMKQADEKPLVEEVKKASVLISNANARIASLEAELVKAQAAEITRSAEALVEKYSDRILPAARETMKSMVLSMGVVEAEKVFNSMGVVAPPTGTKGHGTAGTDSPDKARAQLAEACAKIKNAHPNLSEAEVYRAALRANSTLYKLLQGA